MNYFVHKTAIVDSSDIGDGTRIWDFCNVLKGARIGRNCNICHGCFIESRVSVGNNVTIKNGVYLWDEMLIEDDVFIGSSAVFANDSYPRSGNKNFDRKKILLKKGCSVGANATVLPGVTIGQYAMIGAGAVVTKDIPEFSLAYGNPARVVGKVNIEGRIIKKTS
jgi:UDP-2-acetamido-3-amino-2,3-dideoxy-glucuronate N-acetyltransferase